ncbi:MAG: hypothetical protein ACLSA6_01575 [Holdemania massiliensis]
MNAIYGGRLATFAPKMYLSNAEMPFIRPFIYARENQIRAASGLRRAGCHVDLSDGWIYPPAGHERNARTSAH